MAETKNRIRRALAPLDSNSRTPVKGVGGNGNGKPCERDSTALAKTPGRSIRRAPSLAAPKLAKADATKNATAADEPAFRTEPTAAAEGVEVEAEAEGVFRQAVANDGSIELRLARPVRSTTSAASESFAINDDYGRSESANDVKDIDKIIGGAVDTRYTNEADTSIELVAVPGGNGHGLSPVKIVPDGDLSMEVEKDYVENGGSLEVLQCSAIFDVENIMASSEASAGVAGTANGNGTSQGCFTMSEGRASGLERATGGSTPNFESTTINSCGEIKNRVVFRQRSSSHRASVGRHSSVELKLAHPVGSMRMAMVNTAAASYGDRDDTIPLPVGIVRDGDLSMEVDGDAENGEGEELPWGASVALSGLVNGSQPSVCDKE